jgi:hypothetical protein
MMSRWCLRWEPRSRFGASGRARAISTTSSETCRRNPSTSSAASTAAAAARPGGINSNSGWTASLKRSPSYLRAASPGSPLHMSPAAHRRIKPRRWRSQSATCASAPATVHPLGRRTASVRSSRLAASARRRSRSFRLLSAKPSRPASQSSSPPASTGPFDSQLLEHDDRVLVLGVKFQRLLVVEVHPRRLQRAARLLGLTRQRTSAVLDRGLLPG